jgi:ribonuclease J
MELDWQRVENWINHFGLELHRTHVSGHASGPQLKDFAANVNAKSIWPVHTEHAEIWKKWFGEKVKEVKR